MRKMFLRGLVLLPCILVLSGCVMKSVYNQSFLELREKTADNYSQQVIDVIVDVRENAKIPVFFNVEAGNAAWSPSITTGLTLSIPGPWNARTTGMQPGFQGSSSANNNIQFNDVGTAAMVRVNSLYEFQCFPFKFGDLVLENGTLYTCVSESDSASDLFFARRLESGKYLGVPREKRAEFLSFATEVTYWTQHAAPSLQDLKSTAGIFYRFSIEFFPALASLVQGVNSLKDLEEKRATSQLALEAAQADFSAFMNSLASSKTSPGILEKILNVKKEVLQAQMTSVQGLQAQIQSMRTENATNKKTLYDLESLISAALLDLQAVDLTVNEVNVNSTLEKMERQIRKAEQGDVSILEEIKASRSRGVGLDAVESMDKLYRERFESLPMRYNDSLQTIH
jgi:hypothetical protein